MKTLNLVLIIIAAVTIILAVISRVIVQPISIIAPYMESRALGQLASIILLLVIALNTTK
ncbi:MAG: hypothetical protein AUJ85_06285 [Elusimicrobia bacterium CG1_02_37_114]|nr:MAG: hypothetical protein AUJ85_06285 [Elusimicrobia bacterium CG1_02_37_114]PIV53268.1 MAG: hypothetical protein COS17_04750 [Elusimicrobia bacterium CG02_land_8_20_14_3_00_37_13]PIZ13590.1 MAG: hypothetical protein COY53_03970 [Elusimicrobia bacterium CG_4_10_14_0_8_um_filter_37_32]